MAGTMISWRAGLVVGILVMGASQLTGVRAEQLSDPTRPANAAESLGASVSTEGAFASNPLQSILVVPGRKPRALIAGQWLEQGQLYGDSRVVKIAAGSVILQGVAGGSDPSRQVLTLTPGIEKTKPVKVQPKRAVEIK